MRIGIEGAAVVGLLALLSCNGDNLKGDAGPEPDSRVASRDAMVGGEDGGKPPVADAGVPDAAPSDAAAPDATADAMPADAMPPDAMPADAMPPDAMPDAAVFVEPEYDFLSETGLYDDIENKVIATGVIEFVPEFPLWSDGAEKRRWILLPPGQIIDTSDMDHWQFPIGTKVWKEFHHIIDGNTVLLETRLTEIWGPNRNDKYQASFVWNADDTDAAYARFGASNIKGTDHDAPAQDQCIRCHVGETSKILGFQAVQLSHSGTPNIDDFEAMGLFTNAPAPGGYPVPGNATERDAIGYMHANCGHCHNNSNSSVAGNACYGLPLLQLWVKTTDTMVFDTYAYLELVDQELTYWVSPDEGNVDGYTHRIVRGDPAASAVYYRMGAREAGQMAPLDDDQQMPPIFTDQVDNDGLAAVEAWILSL